MNPNDRPTLGADGSLTGDRLGTGTGIRDGYADGDHGVAGGGAVEYSTGTTTVGLVAADGVVLATDRRASLGGRFVSNKDVVKVEQVHPTAPVAASRGRPTPRPGAR